MVFPSSVSSRGAMAKRDTAGGVPLGLTAVVFGSLPAAPCELFFFCSASSGEPDRRAPDMPSRDSSFRLLIFMDERPPGVFVVSLAPSRSYYDRSSAEERPLRAQASGHAWTRKEGL